MTKKLSVYFKFTPLQVDGKESIQALTSFMDKSVRSFSGSGVAKANTMQLAPIASKIKYSNIVRSVKDQTWLARSRPTAHILWCLQINGLKKRNDLMQVTLINPFRLTLLGSLERMQLINT